MVCFGRGTQSTENEGGRCGLELGPGRAPGLGSGSSSLCESPVPRRQDLTLCQTLWAPMRAQLHAPLPRCAPCSGRLWGLHSGHQVQNWPLPSLRPRGRGAEPPTHPRSHAAHRLPTCPLDGTPPETSQGGSRMALRGSGRSGGRGRRQQGSSLEATAGTACAPPLPTFFLPGCVSLGGRVG